MLPNLFPRGRYIFPWPINLAANQLFHTNHTNLDNVVNGRVDATAQVHPPPFLLSPPPPLTSTTWSTARLIPRRRSIGFMPLASLPLPSSPPPHTLTTWSTARLIPRRRSIGFMPAATDLQPSLRIARVSTVAVVVPEGKHGHACTGEVRCEQGRREARGEEGCQSREEEGHEGKTVKRRGM